VKSVAGFSAWIIVGALLSFAPVAFGQNAASTAALPAATAFNTSPALLLFQGWGGNGGGGNGGGGWGGNGGGGNGGGNGCGGNGGGGGWGGQGGNGWGGNGGGGGCNSVPEGGQPLTYLSLAALCCAGAVSFRLRRQAAVSESK
jgi:hypothetical protein